MKRIIAALLLASLLVVVPAQPSAAISFNPSKEEMDRRLVEIDTELTKLQEENKNADIIAAMWTLIKGTANWYYYEKEESRTFVNYMAHLRDAANSPEVAALLDDRRGILMAEKGWIYLLKGFDYIPDMYDKTAEMAGAAADKTKEIYNDVMSYFGW